jgi:hypothetical protein
MKQEVPNSFSNKWNKGVFDFLQKYSAHSDVAEILIKATKKLGDVQSFCPDPSEFRYVVVSTKGVIFGFAIGMELIAFRLCPVFQKRAIETGGERISGLGEEWVGFTLFRADWPEVDSVFWARQAYVNDREIIIL